MVKSEDIYVKTEEWLYTAVFLLMNKSRKVISRDKSADYVTISAIIKLQGQLILIPILIIIIFLTKQVKQVK
jgi:hypothetical protein